MLLLGVWSRWYPRSKLDHVIKFFGYIIVVIKNQELVLLSDNKPMFHPIRIPLPRTGWMPVVASI